MNKFFTILVLCSCLLAIVEENVAAPNTIESQKTSLTITPDHGPAFKINTNSLNRFSRRNTVISGGHSSHFPLRRSTHDDEESEKGYKGSDENSSSSSVHEAEEMLEEASTLLATLQRLRRNNKGDTVEVKGEVFDQIISVLESYEDTLTDIVNEDVASSSSYGKDDQEYDESENQDNEDYRKQRVKLARAKLRNMKGSHHGHSGFSRRNRSNKVVSHHGWVIKP